MRVARLAHAGIVVSAGNDRITDRIIMDPMLFNEFDCGMARLEPPIAFRSKLFDPDSFSAIILSHDHSDHFSVASLNLLSRKTPIYYPKGATLIDFALRWMGFQSIRPLKPYQRAQIGSIEITATPSQVDFPEMGIVFRTRNSTVWNLVDTATDLACIRRVRKKFGRVDLMLAQYQPIIEVELQQDALGAAFPFERYRALVRNVLELNPRAVVPSSCGFKLTHCQWMNDRQFPLDEAKFMGDLKKLNSKIKLFSLSSGQELRVDGPRGPNGARRFQKAQGLAFIGPRLKKQRPAPSYDWRPERGVPPLADMNPIRATEKDLRRRVGDFLERDLFSELNTPVHRDWLKKMRAFGVNWILEVVYPSGRREERRLSFSRPGLEWAHADFDFYHLRTCVTASAIAGLRSGELTPAAVAMGGLIRQTNRMYAIDRGKLCEWGPVVDDPIWQTLFDRAWDRSLVWQLQRL